MKNSVKLISLLLVILVSACSSVKVVSDQDKTVDFSQYKTYNFLGWQDDSGDQINQFDKKRMRDAFIAEFTARGITYQESGADMNVSLYIVLDKRTSVTAYTDYYGGGAYGGYGRYNSGWGAGYGHGSAQTTYQEDDYVEGTLVMDVFDDKDKQQVWQGIAVSTVSSKPERREKTIPKKIKMLMAKFPVVMISK